MASDRATSICTGNGESDGDLAGVAGLAAGGAAGAGLAAGAAGAGLAACAAGAGLAAGAAGAGLAAGAAGAGLATCEAGGEVEACAVAGWKAPGTASKASHLSASILARLTWPVSDGALPSSRASVPVAVSPPIDILKSVTANRVAVYSMPPSKVKLPTTEASKSGGAWPVARMTAPMKSVNAPVATVRCPFTSALALTSLTVPLKSSVPLSTFRLNSVAWPSASAAPRLKSSDSGTPFTVALPEIANGPAREPTDAVAATSSALNVWPLCGLV